MVSFLFFGVGFFKTEFYVYRGSLRGNYLSRNNKCSFLPLLDFERHFFGVWQKILARLSKLHSASLEDLSVVNEITGKKTFFFEISRGFTIKTDLTSVHIFSSSQTLRRENPFFEWKFTAWLSKLPSTRTSNHFQEKKSSQRIHFLVTSPDSGQNNFGSIENFFSIFVKTTFCISRRSPFCFRFWTFFLPILFPDLSRKCLEF